MIEIFEQEIVDGLKDAIENSSKAGVVYQSKISVPKDIERYLSKASEVTDPTLYPLDSIFASVGWNLNDDVFTKEELWKARQSTVDKPVNRGHNARDIVGHTKAYMVLDKDLNVIPENTIPETLPDFFHLATSAVLYKAWEDEEMEKSIAQLIEEIQQDKWYVSMECFFKGFDYAIIDPKTSDKYVIARTKETAFLTKNLMIYGGRGEYQGYRIGRQLRNIVFNGKGIVEQPANPESIIFSNITPFAHAKVINNVYDITESEKSIKETMMPENTNDALIAELKAAKASLEAKVDELTKTASDAANHVVNAKVENLTKEVETRDATIAELNKKVSDLEAVKAEMNAGLAEANKKFAEAEEKLNKIATDALRNTRINTLVEAGLNKDEATAKAEKFAGLNDEMFAEIVALAKASKPAQKVEETVEGAAAKVVEEVKKEEEAAPTGGSPNTNEEKEAAFASLQTGLESILAQYKSKK